MRTLPIVLLLLVSTLIAGPLGAQVEQITSPAGHEIYFLQLPEAENVAIQVSWPSSWPTTTGRNQAVPFIATELMATGGAGELSPSEIVEQFNDSQTASSLIPTVESVRGSLVTQKSQLETSVELANTVLTDPSLAEAWLRRVKDGLQARIGQANGIITNKAFDVARVAILGTGPIRDSLSLPDVGVIGQVSHDEVVAFHRETFITNGMTIAIAGALSVEEAGQAIDKLLDGMPAGDGRISAEVNYDFSPRSVLLHAPDLEQSFLGFIGQMPPTREGGEFEDLLAITLLGQGENSELFQAVRTRLRAGYGFTAGVANFTRDIRFLFLAGEVEAERLSEVRDVVVETYGGFIENGPSSDVGGLKAMIANGLATNIGNPVVASTMMIEALLDDLDPNRVMAITEEINTVTQETVKARLSNDFPKREELITIAISPDENALPGACVISSSEQIAQCR